MGCGYTGWLDCTESNPLSPALVLVRHSARTLHPTAYSWGASRAQPGLLLTSKELSAVLLLRSLHASYCQKTFRFPRRKPLLTTHNSRTSEEIFIQCVISRLFKSTGPDCLFVQFRPIFGNLCIHAKIYPVPKTSEIFSHLPMFATKLWARRYDSLASITWAQYPLDDLH